jgi:hypothetical protein
VMRRIAAPCRRGATDARLPIAPGQFFKSLAALASSDAAMAPPSASESPSSVSSDGGLQIWDVQDILAERTSVAGRKELLVLWKPSWIPHSDVLPDSPVMRRFRWKPMLNFASESGCFRIKLPVEPGSTLAQDFAEEKAAVFHARIRAAGCDAVMVTMGGRRDDGAAPTKKRRNTGKQ